ncbi:MAG: hypothetical protein M1825_002090 [Sarcosagium campestre]|nr:MAG: hypothetical protein M1825_002090 [Sarcosagium campestre]
MRARRAHGGRRTPGLSPSRRHGANGIEDEDRDGDLFPQFCANCDKQLTTPHNSSVLYCSDNCRNQDTASESANSRTLPTYPRTTSTASIASPPLTPVATSKPYSAPPPNFIPPASPTAPPSYSSNSPPSSRTFRPHSLPPPSPPHYQHHSSHSQHMFSSSTTIRPLPPRTNTTASSPRGVELVTPWAYTSAPMARRPASQEAGNLLYEKTWSGAKHADAAVEQAGLRRLFALREMQEAGR